MNLPVDGAYTDRHISPIAQEIVGGHKRLIDKYNNPGLSPFIGVDDGNGQVSTAISVVVHDMTRLCRRSFPTRGPVVRDHDRQTETISRRHDQWHDLRP